MTCARPFLPANARLLPWGAGVPRTVMTSSATARPARRGAVLGVRALVRREREPLFVVVAQASHLLGEPAALLRCHPLDRAPALHAPVARVRRCLAHGTIACRSYSAAVCSRIASATSSRA